jgi:hypothetical protein
MNNEKILKTAVIPGAIALAAILLSVSLPFNATLVAAFGCVAVLLGILALEYGVTSKRLSSR